MNVKLLDRKRPKALSTSTTHVPETQTGPLTSSGLVSDYSAGPCGQHHRTTWTRNTSKNGAVGVAAHRARFIYWPSIHAASSEADSASAGWRKRVVRLDRSIADGDYDLMRRRYPTNKSGWPWLGFRCAFYCATTRRMQQFAHLLDDLLISLSLYLKYNKQLSQERFPLMIDLPTTTPNMRSLLRNLLNSAPFDSILFDHVNIPYATIATFNKIAQILRSEYLNLTRHTQSSIPCTSCSRKTAF